MHVHKDATTQYMELSGFNILYHEEKYVQHVHRVDADGEPHDIRYETALQDDIGRCMESETNRKVVE